MKLTRKKQLKKGKSIRSKPKKINNTKKNTLKSVYKSKKLLTKTSNKKQLGGNKIEKKVHQIWFGGGDPKWRKYLFDKNA